LLNHETRDTVQTASNVLIGIGTMLAAIGSLKFIRSRFAQNPKKLKQYDIEANDERNIRLYEKSGYIAWKITTYALFTLFIASVIFNFDSVRWLFLGALIIHSISFIVAIIVQSKKL